MSMGTSLKNVLAVVLGGGQGTRLFPLTQQRAKPAVPLAGKYRLVDIPISNCINSGIDRVYVLTMFNSASLHRHISHTYKFDHFSRGFVEILAAEQTLTDKTWYQGTADAVRKNLMHFLGRYSEEIEYMIILSGDALYRMDFRNILEQHMRTGAEITIATIPVSRAEAQALGIMQISDDLRITRFQEKPKDPALLDSLRLPREWHERLGIKAEGDVFLASMGIYVFNVHVLAHLLDSTLADFGKHVIPVAIDLNRVCSYIFQGYWEDIGTIRSFFEANLDLAAELPAFNFFDMSAPIYTRPRYLPSSKINGAAIDHAIISDGCIINHARINLSIVGVRSIVEAGTELNRVVLMGNDFYESAESIRLHAEDHRPRIGIGRNCRIENAIIDKNSRVGDNCVITPAGKPENMDDPMAGFYIRDGIVIIPKGGEVRDGTVI